MIPEKVLERYVRVKALAERGYQGEKKVAQAMAQKLRAEYPGIDAATVRGYLDDIFSDVCRNNGAPA